MGKIRRAEFSSTKLKNGKKNKSGKPNINDTRFGCCLDFINFFALNIWYFVSVSFGIRPSLMRCSLHAQCVGHPSHLFILIYYPASVDSKFSRDRHNCARAKKKNQRHTLTLTRLINTNLMQREKSWFGFIFRAQRNANTMRLWEKKMWISNGKWRAFRRVRGIGLEKSEEKTHNRE